MYSKVNLANGDREFWMSLARSVELKVIEHTLSRRNTVIKQEITVSSTQHITFYPIVRSNAGREGFLINQAKVVHSSGMWDVDFVVGVVEPFMLDISARRETGDLSYFNTANPKYMMEVVKNCFASLLDKRTVSCNDNLSVFKFLTDNLVFNELDGTIFLNCVEKAKLQEFAEQNIDLDKQKLIEDTIDENALGTAMRSAVKASIANASTSDRQCSDSLDQIEADKKLNSDVIAQKCFVNSRVSRGMEVPLPVVKGSMKHHGAVGYTNVLTLAASLARNTADEISNYVYVSDVLSSVSQRSRASKNVLISSLKDDSDLGPYLDCCSVSDVSSLAQDCYLKSFDRQNDYLATEGGNINGLYIIIKGTLKYQYKGQAVVKTKGNMIGEQLLSGIRSWDLSIPIWKHEVIHFCVIPANSVLQYIGIHRPDTSIYMHCFWKYSRLWALLADPRSASQQVRDSVLSISAAAATSHVHQSQISYGNMNAREMHGVAEQSDPILSNDSASRNSSSSSSNPKNDECFEESEEMTTETIVSGLRPTLAPPLAIEPKASSVNLKEENGKMIVDCCRVHYFQAGSDVFKEATPRHFLYVVIKGECALVRNINVNNPSGSRPNSSKSPKRQHAESRRGDRSDRSPSPIAGSRPQSSSGRAESPSPLKLMVDTSAGIDSPNVSTRKNRDASHSPTRPQSPVRPHSPSVRPGSASRRSPGRAGSPGSKDNFIEVSIGQHLLPGDFCFMDGESNDWFAKNDEAISRKIAHNMNAPLLFRRNNLFGEHKHSLLALTMSEVCVVPLQNVYQFGAIFIALLKLANESYPMLSKTDIELLAERTNNMVFEGNRPKLVTKLIKDSIGRIPTAEAISATHHRKDKMYESYEALVKDHKAKISSAKQALTQATISSRPSTATTTAEIDRSDFSPMIPTPPSTSRPASSSSKYRSLG